MRDLLHHILKTSGKFYLKRIREHQHLSEAINRYPGDTDRERLFNFIHYNTKRPVCKHCGGKNTFRNLSVGYLEFCSYTCAGNFPANKIKNSIKQRSIEVRQKTEETNREKYGADYHLKTEKSKEKLRAFNQEKYGVDWLTSSSYFQEKAQETWIEKYGVSNPSQNKEIRQKQENIYRQKYDGLGLQSSQVQEKVKQTCIERYGVENPFSNTEIQEKIAKTNILKYGCLHPIQNQDVAIKIFRKAISKKPYTFENGDIVSVMGYEHFALDILQKNFLREDIIVEHDLPKIMYDFDGKTSRYYPDIFIKSKNLIIEVKSTYTFESDKERNLRKREASILAGFSFQFWIFDRDGTLLDTIY